MLDVNFRCHVPESPRRQTSPFFLLTPSRPISHRSHPNPRTSNPVAGWHITWVSNPCWNILPETPLHLSVTCISRLVCVCARVRACVWARARARNAGYGSVMWAYQLIWWLWWKFDTAGCVFPANLCAGPSTSLHTLLGWCEQIIYYRACGQWTALGGRLLSAFYVSLWIVYSVHCKITVCWCLSQPGGGFTLSLPGEIP